MSITVKTHEDEYSAVLEDSTHHRFVSNDKRPRDKALPEIACALPAGTTLSELGLGESCYVQTIRNNGLMRRRLLDLGFIPGTKITAVLGDKKIDPRVYRIRDTSIALRSRDANLVVIDDNPPGDTSSNGGAPALCRTCPSKKDHFPTNGRSRSKGEFQFAVALAGNPNTGKSTLFNALTGLRQHVGNWPGKTVSRAEGTWKYLDYEFKLIDLPGTYSLLSTSLEEEIARDYILFGAPDCTVVVVDAVSLERNLNLVFQILEITSRVVVCVNLIDEAQRKGIKIDGKKLEEHLGVPVVLTVARSRKGLEQLQEKILGVANGDIITAPARTNFDPEIQEAIDELVPHIERVFPDLPNARWIALRLIDGGDKRLREEMEEGVLAEISGRVGDHSLGVGSPTAREIKR